MKFLTKHQIHIACLQETSTSAPILDGFDYVSVSTSYDFNHHDSHTNTILVHKSLQCNISKISHHSSGRCSAIDIHLHGERIRVTNIYLPSGHQLKSSLKRKKEKDTKVCDEILNFLENLEPCSMQAILGDFNECFLNERVTKCKKTMASLKFYCIY